MDVIGQTVCAEHFTTSEKKNCGFHWVGGCVSAGAGLDILEKG
jgi:hypothetical protein